MKSFLPRFQCQASPRIGNPSPPRDFRLRLSRVKGIASPSSNRTSCRLTSPPFVDNSELEIGCVGNSSPTYFCVLTRGQMVECTMGPMFVVVDAGVIGKAK